MFDVVYRTVRGSLAELAAGLRAEQCNAPVPATPGWTVHGLLSHLVGLAHDVSTGRMDGAPGEEWTRRQVSERRDTPIGELLAEWERFGPSVEPTLAGEVRGPNAGLDIVCHQADLHEALGLSRPERAHWQPALEVMVGFLGRRLKQPGTLEIRDDSGQLWSFGEGEPLTRLRVDGYELLRATFSRRSQRQLLEWDWNPAPVQRLERVGAFGPRTDDQPVPAVPRV